VVEEIFLDARKNPPRPDDVMARFRAMAELVDGQDKSIVIDFIKSNPIGADMAVKTLKNRCGALSLDATRVAMEIAEDLVSGVSEEAVKQKPYKMQIEMIFYCKKEDVPHDPHWDLLPTVRLDQKRSCN
jgi:hypothetical protein